MSATCGAMVVPRVKTAMRESIVHRQRAIIIIIILLVDLPVYPVYVVWASERGVQHRYRVVSRRYLYLTSGEDGA